MKKTKISFLEITTCVLLICAFLMWGLSTAWGNVKIQRVTMPYSNGNKTSFTIWIPKEASDENPLPVVVNYLGRGDAARQVDSWAIEESRRGYVAVNVDWNGTGDADRDVDHIGAVNAYLQSLPFVDTQKMCVVGWSAGTGLVMESLHNYPDNYVAGVSIFPPFTGMIDNEINSNMMLVKASADQYNYALQGDEALIIATFEETFGLEGVESGKVYGSFADGTAREYYLVDHTIHQQGNITNVGIAVMLNFFDQSSGHISNIPAEKNIHSLFLFVSLLGYASLIFFAAALGMTLLKLPYFAPLKKSLPENKGKRGGAWWKSFGTSLAFSLISFIPVSWLGMNILAYFPAVEKIMPSNNLNSIVSWLFFTGIFAFVLVAVSMNKKKKSEGKVNLADYAMGEEGQTAIDWSNVGRAALLGLIVVITVFAWIRFADSVLGIGYNFSAGWMGASFIPLAGKRIPYCIPYVIILTFVMFATSIGMNTNLRLAETGNETLDTVKAIVVSGLVGALPVLILLAVQYVGCAIINTGYCIFPQLQNFNGGGTSVGALDFAGGFPIMMFSMTGLTTYFHRKTGSVWVGVFIAGFIGAVAAVSSANLII